MLHVIQIHTLSSVFARLFRTLDERDDEVAKEISAGATPYHEDGIGRRRMVQTGTIPAEGWLDPAIGGAAVRAVLP